MNNSDIGIIGLGVMGENLALNMAGKGFRLAVYNRTLSKTNRFIQGHGAGKAIRGFSDLASFAASLKKPRKALLMVQAGIGVDHTIEGLLSVFEPGDIIIDGGNSNYRDTIKRTAYVESKGLWYVGTGVSGGEEGALTGPSLMPGGSVQAWDAIKPLFQAIAAKVEGTIPCCDWVGENGAGHFVKMVHNGIEYGDMELICEAYAMLKHIAGLSYTEMADVFERWNKGVLNSYLIGITAEILKFKDRDGGPLAEKILDTAGQKGTGTWTGIAALEFGVPLTLIGEAVFSRCLSAAKSERVRCSKIFSGPKIEKPQNIEAFINDVEQALYAAKVVSYAQGYLLMREAAKEYKWNLNYGGIALIWRGGCIIRSVFLEKIKEAFDKKPDLENLLLAPFFTSAIEESQAAWRRVAGAAVENGVPAPAFLSALAYFDGYRSERLPANLLQAQRDYFGAHTYERVDRPRGEFFHTNWLEGIERSEESAGL
ncbi:MAG: decarboxylating NADP(+)-dependent phosphogluconate dehydrogenase [Spirochaetaceae bacterium]|jgi:6-phosphogluconate dehydrogenase|nr:decarboxylating NADP(+)-dependent phosphogluconate dehydrogenase [Spirochaetaceae bacterium]